MPSLHATAGKLPWPGKKRTGYLHELVNGAHCRDRSLSVVVQWLRKGKYILRATVWYNCPEVNLAKTGLHLAIFVDYSSLSKHQVTEDNREGNQLWGQRRLNSMKRIHSPVHSHKSILFRLTCPFQVDLWSELQVGHTNHGTSELQGTLEIIESLSLILELKK